MQGRKTRQLNEIVFPLKSTITSCLNQKTKPYQLTKKSEITQQKEQVPTSPDWLFLCGFAYCTFCLLISVTCHFQTGIYF